MSWDTWQPCEDAYLREHYPSADLGQVCSKLGRTLKAVQMRASKLGISRDISAVRAARAIAGASGASAMWRRAEAQANQSIVTSALAQRTALEAVWGRAAA